jgi:hypothetical protein
MEAMLDAPPADMRTALAQWAADKGVSIG